jgi:hypothetical protein
MESNAQAQDQSPPIVINHTVGTWHKAQTTTPRMVVWLGVAVEEGAERVVESTDVDFGFGVGFGVDFDATGLGVEMGAGAGVGCGVGP